MLELSFGFSSLGLFLDSTNVSFFETSSTISLFFLDPLKLSRSIFPKWIGFFISFLSMKEACFLSFSSSSFSFFNLNSSFSFLFSSLKSWDSTLFDLSELNSFKNKLYWSGEILVVGLASISWPFEAKNSTALSREILNSLSTLFNLVNLVSLIYIILKIRLLIHFWPR